AQTRSNTEGWTLLEYPTPTFCISLRIVDSRSPIPSSQMYSPLNWIKGGKDNLFSQELRKNADGRPCCRTVDFSLAIWNENSFRCAPGNRNPKRSPLASHFPINCGNVPPPVLT